MSLELLPLHEYPEYIIECCKLINEEWKRSDTARLRSLECSSDKLPTCLILIQNKKVIGHAKLSVIPSIKLACFLESVVIDKGLRGKGLGTILMKNTEDYCRDILKLKTIYLSTKGQEEFYRKLGYYECQPVSIYGGCISNQLINNSQTVVEKKPANITLGPPPPPLPQLNVLTNLKTFMKKKL